MGEKVKTIDISGTVATWDLKVGKCRQIKGIMKVCE